MDKISINLPETYTENQIEIVHREGKAAPIKETQGVNIQGSISAPADFFTGKIANDLSMDLSRARVEVDYEKMCIWLHTDEHIPTQGYSVFGEILTHPALDKFKINKDNKWTLKALAQFLKMNRAYFNDADENMTIVSNLQSFKAKVVQEIENANDLKGNKKYLFEQKLRHEIPLEFTLNMPIFKNGDSIKFKVDILTDITEGSVSFWMESVELRELEIKLSEGMINGELKKLKGLTIITI